ncbi:intein-containing recombinase RecA [Nocardiopsis lucentensis]|uniref:intein-containing recombinase RecA n=1 Tax=Nocardiopsis lucentensis TaxID=53441 RepID=UPI000345D9B6|nr:intein-containing recombinase RecA [Nocardiopsis lucentensis]
MRIMKKKASTQQGYPVASGDRDKALETALAQIERQFGKGSVMRLGDDDRPPIESIPTGAIALDVALGIGGIPKGRIVEVYGPESSGKCLTADTYVWTDRGMETIAELFERAGQSATCASRVTDVRDQGIRVVNERGELETVAALTHNNRKPVLRITTESGRRVTVTHNHPLRVVNEEGFVVWRKAGKLKEGDTLVSARFGANEAAEGSGLSEDEAVFLGYLVAEGTLGSTTSVRFTNGDDEVGQEFTSIARWLFDTEAKVYEGNNCREYVLPGVQLREEVADRYGLDYVNSAGKRVPHVVRTGGDKIQRAFLSALYEGDGWIDDSSTIGLGTASEQLARDVQILLYGLGVPASLYRKFNTTYERHYWTVAVNPSVAHRFLSEVGFRSRRRAAQVEKNFRLSGRSPQFENIPHITGLISSLRDSLGGDRDFDRVAGDLFRGETAPSCSRNRLVDIIEWARSREQRLSASGEVILSHLEELAVAPYTYEPITVIEDGGNQPTFDIMLPETHSFLANGIVSHNTTVALHAVANAQKAGGIAAFVDAEHALDPTYAKKIGVDTDNLLLSQPDTGEQALEIVDMLIRSGAVSIIVVDSVAALVPRAEIEGEMGDSHVGLQARLMSQALRKIAGALHQTGTTAIFINQLREKVGVMFGCMQYGTRVTLADGTQEKIGEIVNQKMDVEVLSYDPERDEVVPRKVVNWFDNGVADHFLQFTVARSGKNGRSQFAATPNHLIRTPGGWREAGELLPGDRVLTAQTHYLSEQQRQVVLGSVMGDGSLSPNTRDRDGTRFRMGHGVAQADYLDWKVSLLGNIGCSRTTNDKGAVFADFTPLPELAELREAVYFGDGKKHLSWEYLKRLTPLALAVWYMDDGCFTTRSKGVQARTEGGSGRIEICVEAMSPGTRDRLTEHLRDTYGLDAKLVARGSAGKYSIQFTTAASAKFQELVAPYVHESMSYKLLPRFQGQCQVVPELTEPVERLVASPILDIHVKPETRSMRKFDIEVEGNHNYFVDGVMVHNSPETTTGGKALKFYASVRLDVRRIETLKDGTDAVGNRTRVKVVKNKVAPPFKQAEFDILYGVGVSREGSLIDLGVEHGIVRKSGAWYTYEGTQLGQGKENARRFMRENVDVANEIEKKIKEKLGVPGAGDDSASGSDSDAPAKEAAAKDAPAKEAPVKEAPAKAPTKRAPAKTTKAPTAPDA